jgi:uncharacterized protein YhaN
MQDVHPKAKKKKRQRKKPINMREAKQFFTGMEQRLKQKEPEQRLTKSERHVDGMKLPALRHYLTSTMDGMNRETLLEAMRVLIAGMNTKVGRECASVFLAYEEAEEEAAGEAEEEADGEAEEEADGEAEEEADGEAEEEADGEAEDDGVRASNPEWIKSRFSRSGYKGVSRDRGRWKCTVLGQTVARCDTIAEACDMYLKEWS